MLKIKQSVKNRMYKLKIKILKKIKILNYLTLIINKIYKKLNYIKLKILIKH